MKPVEEIRRQNLNELISASGSLRVFCEIVNISDSQVSQWATAAINSGTGKRRNISAPSCRAIEKALNKTPNWMDYEHGLNQEIDLENNPDFPAVKKVNIRVSAGITGFGIDPCTGDDSLIVFRADWYQSRRLKPENLLALKVSGASMEPNLYDGDVVVMNKADTTLKDGEVFVFNLDGEVVIKRAVRDGGQWWLDSDNQDKTRFTRKACPDGICIPLGKVIHRQTERI